MSNSIYSRHGVGANGNFNPGFWARHLRGTYTRERLIFDIALGIVLPQLCFTFDPAIFKGGAITGEPLVGRFAPLVYSFCAISMSVLALWFTLGSKLTAFKSGIVAGVLLTAAGCSLLLGLLLLPFSLLGLIVLIGALGFSPFLTSFAYLRGGIRALDHAKNHPLRTGLAPALLLGSLIALTPSVLAQVGVNRIVTPAVNELLSGDEHKAASAVRRLKYFGWAADMSRVINAYREEVDPARRVELATAFERITGGKIEQAVAMRD